MLARIFVFDSDTGLLQGFGGEAEALQGAADNAKGLLFFAAKGSALRRERLPDGAYYLRPWASCGSCHLAQVLHAVRVVRINAQDASLDAVRKQIEGGDDE